MSFLDSMNLIETNPSVHIDEEKREHVERTLRALANDGRSMLHVVADFDFTLTMYEKDGKALPSTYAVIENDERVKLPDGSLVRVQTEELRSKYHPIEYDPSLTVEEKTPLMIEWWHKAQSLLLASNLTKSMVRDLVHQSKLELRKGVRTFLTELLREKIPVLIFSAGLGDVIEVFLEKEVPEFDGDRRSAHIVSNFLQYDTKGNALAFSEKLIHSFNKNEHEIQEMSYCQSISQRSNVILLGDTLGDVGMISGMKHLKHVLKIGFLNRSTPAKLDLYKRLFDIVICDSPTFDIPNVILNSI